MKNAFFYIAGIAFLVLAKIKHVVRGYTTPKPFALDEVDRCIDYDVTIAGRFVENLERYGSLTLQGKRLLELGPGSDLGIGLILISKGAASYIGFDRHNLAGQVTRAFYERFAKRLPVDLAALKDGRVRYVARQDFDIEAAIPPEIDIVLSNAAFEHFDDVESTVEQLSRITRAGGKAVVEIDLKTHSRWIRGVDPNNIYRYPEWLYRLLRYPGQPNRMRPDDYRRAFEHAGWTDIKLYSANLLSEQFADRTVHHTFRGRQLDWLSFVLCATRA